MKPIHVLITLLSLLIVLIAVYGDMWIQVNRSKPTVIHIYVYGDYSSIVATPDELLVKDREGRE